MPLADFQRLTKMLQTVRRIIKRQKRKVTGVGQSAGSGRPLGRFRSVHEHCGSRTFLTEVDESICEEAAMPKTIRVELKGFSGDFDEAIGPGGIAIHGQIFGVTFDEAPDGRRDFTRTDIFSFPDGPLTIRNHQMTRVETSENYTLVNPTLDGSGVAPKQLEFGGRLFRADGSKFGEGFRIVTTFSPTPEGTRDTIVRVVNGNQEIKLHLFLEVTMSF